MQNLRHASSEESRDLVQLSLQYRSQVCEVVNVLQSEASDGEMAAFCAFAQAFPAGFVALVDTYDVIK